MENQVTMKRNPGPKEEGAEYIEFIDDLTFVFRATNQFGWRDKDYIIKDNEPLVKLMKIVFALNDEDIPFSKIRKKYGRRFVHNTGDGHSHMEFPIKVRV